MLGKTSEQLSFDLHAHNPYAARYFVPHSGVIDAVLSLRRAIDLLLRDETCFSAIYAFGRQSSGKTHLLSAAVENALQAGLAKTKLFFCDLSECPRGYSDDTVASQFVAAYDRLKREGGVLLAVGDRAPQDREINPHLKSRLLAGEIFELGPPQESELRPLLLSMLERKNLRLSEYSLNYLLRRLPRDTLSFERIFAKIHELCFSLGRPANWSTVREVVERYHPEERSDG